MSDALGHEAVVARHRDTGPGRPVWLLAALVLCMACPRSQTPVSSDNPRVRIRSFAEPAAVRMVTAAPPYLFSAAERGMIRWNLENGQHLILSAEHGLPGDRVEAMTFDREREHLWVATDGGVTRYDIKRGMFTELRTPTMSLGLDSFAGVSLAPARDGGLYVGHRNGVYHASADGEWRMDDDTIGRVGGMVRSRDGSVWIAGESGLIVRRPDGSEAEYGNRGCSLPKVDFIASTPTGLPVIVGKNDKGKQRVMFVQGNSCGIYRVKGERWLGAAVRGDDLVVLTERRLYRATAEQSAAARIVGRAKMSLEPVSDSTSKSPYVFRRLGANLPGGSRCIDALDDEVFVGTDFLGTARIYTQAGEPRLGWLRRSELVSGARLLSVACADVDDCYISTGAPQSWHYTGDRFEREEALGSYTLAFARNPKGVLYAVARSVNERDIELHRYNGKSWQRIRTVTNVVPGTMPSLSFARFSPGGSLWVGLRYRDEEGEHRSYGVAVIRTAKRRKVVYHRMRGLGSVESSGWPIPLDASDASFIDNEEIWLAASDGAIQVKKGEVTIHTEPEGTEGDLVRGVTVSPGGLVFAATRSGVATYNGDVWDFPPDLRRRVTDVEVDASGRLWMATNRGVAMFAGTKVHRVSMRAGLLENQIDEVAIDHLGRVWARSSQGLTLIIP